jgi:hypothetical protein
MKRGFEPAELSREGTLDEKYLGHPYAMFFTADGRYVRISTTPSNQTRFIGHGDCYKYLYAEHGGGVTFSGFGLVAGKTTQMIGMYPGWIFHVEDHTLTKRAAMQVWCEPKPDEEEIARVKKYAMAVISPA